jgi:F0F1-type ATP synthase beta subunit
MIYGEIIQVIGPVVDIVFPEGETPQIFDAVKVEDPEK